MTDARSGDMAIKNGRQVDFNLPTCPRCKSPLRRSFKADPLKCYTCGYVAWGTQPLLVKPHPVGPNWKGEAYRGVV